MSRSPSATRRAAAQNAYLDRLEGRADLGVLADDRQLRGAQRNRARRVSATTLPPTTICTEREGEQNDREHGSPPLILLRSDDGEEDLGGEHFVVAAENERIAEICKEIGRAHV